MPTPTRSGDVLTAKNGKTIEINNTDAEGRLVLADCLHHARTLGATHVVDLATLTGAVVVALGDFHAGIMGRDQDWVDQPGGRRRAIGRPPVAAAAARDVRAVHPLGHRRHDQLLAAGHGRRRRTRRGSCRSSPGEGPWAHLDIAGTADLPRPRGDEFAKGGTGFGVRLLVELAESLC